MRHHFKACRVSVPENKLLNVISKGISPIMSPIINVTRYCFLARFSKVQVLVFLFVVGISVDAGWAGTKGQPTVVSINH